MYIAEGYDLAKLIDLTGMQFGEWRVIEYAGDRQWICECSCGKISAVLGSSLRNGRSKSCGHGTTAFKDIEGMQFGEWTVIEEVNTGYYKCKCSCGITRTVNKYHLLSGRSKSCGHTNKGGFVSKEYIDNNKRDVTPNTRLDNIDVGDIVGEWEVLKRGENSYWLCRCSCGKELLVHDWSLRTGRSKSCGHNKLQDLKGKHFGEWEVIDYSGKSYWKCRCSCGNIADIRKQDLVSGASKSCGHNRNQIKRDLTGHRYGMLTVEKYVGSMTYKCLCECGNTKYILSTNLLNGGTLSCGCKNASKYTDEYLSKLIDNYTYLKGEKPFRVELAEILGIHVGYLCKLINKYELEDKINNEFRSRYEREVYEYIKDMRDDIEIITNDKSLLNGSELDIYIPKLELAIEFNGDYWHSSINKPKYYHQNKSIDCGKHGVQLIHIFEYEWNNEDVKNKLKKIIRNKVVNRGKSVVYARKCEVRHVNKSDEVNFLNNNHLQNYASSSVAYGLYNNNELLSLMTFGKPRFNSWYDLELIRYCTNLDITIVGGAEKIFKAMLSELKPKSIITYCDISKFTGEVYNKLGFRADELGITQPNYKWVGNNEVLSRYQTKKHNLILEGYEEYGGTEDEIMINRGYLKIYDSGNLKLTWKKY